MNKTFTKMTLLSSLIISFIVLSNAPVSAQHKGDVITDTFKGNHLFTSKFEKYDGSRLTGWCTSVILTPTTSLTAAHCINYENKKDTSIGYIYPALSGISTPLSYMQITESLSYNPLRSLGSRDIAIIKGTKPSSSMLNYLKEKAPQIKTVSDNYATDLIGQEVYTIGYPYAKGSNYQIRYNGKITEPKLRGYQSIETDIDTKVAGRSGSGLFLQSTNELIGILSGSDESSGITIFAPITDEARKWIDGHR